ncbi:ABC-type transport system, involved in lipoprotein release, permease component [Desulfatibacillum alkenivorans DSM 16219]|jgi:ABC-type lipoprotein release transport system permease subunit|uniref:ABC-type transport system, involved in lipoprotein release, permease component n=1 Tax=Desulfatibacillum alkenivorans DSM 16219 TaxID=1121393 RepID=A0A1M6PBN7_9BACT|nr:FtsX-like permease family protein [Desulfatibacillum alkenivorans]SHK05365.1 ABC-type transport system, involved in lipoprotein release, permease component [Desulfatibacillum alkenivorans DSM 16219]
MGDLKLAWRNIWRHTRRSILTMMAIGFASLLLVFMLSFQFGSYEGMIDASVRLSTGHLQVQAQGYHDKPEMRKVVKNPRKVMDALSRTPGVEACTARCQTFVLASSEDRTRGVMIMGVDPETESRVLKTSSLIRQGEYLSSDDPNTVIIGALLAERLKIGLGEELTILGQARDGSIAATVMTVRGIFKSGIDEVDRSTVQMLLTDFDQLFGMDGAVHAVVAVVHKLTEVGEIKNTVMQDDALKGLAVLDWMELSPGLKQSIQMDLVSGIIMYVILIIVVAFSIMNTFLMAVFERTREFGVMMAIGVKPLRLVKIILMESMFMTGLGLLFGMILGALLTQYFAGAGISMGGAADLMAQYGISGRMYPRLSLITLFSGPILIGVVTFFTALLPALRIPRLKPANAMKAV